MTRDIFFGGAFDDLCRIYSYPRHRFTIYSVLVLSGDLLPTLSMHQQYFGKGFESLAIRRSYYEHTEAFIKSNVASWEAPPDTDGLGKKYWDSLRRLSKEELAFLVLVSGYIPEFYAEDSSQETLYSKLVEIIVAEWGLRVGFQDTSIQKQKSSKEDVTLRLGGEVIVCDTKTFRLGRSQAAPNVKDTLKKANYGKWLESYNPEERIGGMITFPSLFRWKGGSDAYLYCTDHESPIALTLYEHLSFFLVANLQPSVFFSHLKNYKKLFPAPTKRQAEYFAGMDKSLFETKHAAWEQFKKDTAAVLGERVEFSKEKIKAHLLKRKVVIEAEVGNMKPEEIRPKLITSMYDNECSELERQLNNITRFRNPTADV